MNTTVSLLPAAGGHSLIAPPSKRTKFLATYRPNQEWSFPDCFIYYITKNPSASKAYEKMIQSCKYFFIQNHILLIPHPIYQYPYDGWNIYSKENRVNLNNLSSKIWITDGLRISDIRSTFPLSSLIPRIYQSDIKLLTFYNLNISLHELELLASKCEDVNFYWITVTNSDGLVVGLEKIVKVLHNVKKLYYALGHIRQGIIASNTAKELLKIPHFWDLRYFSLLYITETFDIETFYDYIKKNKKTKIHLSFCQRISDAYKARLQAIVYEIIEVRNREYNVPWIDFPGISRNLSLNLYTLFQN